MSVKTKGKCPKSKIDTESKRLFSSITRLHLRGVSKCVNSFCRDDNSLSEWYSNNKDQMKEELSSDLLSVDIQHSEIKRLDSCILSKLEKVFEWTNTRPLISNGKRILSSNMEPVQFKNFVDNGKMEEIYALLMVVFVHILYNLCKKYQLFVCTNGNNNNNNNNNILLLKDRFLSHCVHWIQKEKLLDGKTKIFLSNKGLGKSAVYGKLTKTFTNRYGNNNVHSTVSQCIDRCFDNEESGIWQFIRDSKFDDKSRSRAEVTYNAFCGLYSNLTEQAVASSNSSSNSTSNSTSNSSNSSDSDDDLMISNKNKSNNSRYKPRSNNNNNSKLRDDSEYDDEDDIDIDNYNDNDTARDSVEIDAQTKELARQRAGLIKQYSDAANIDYDSGYSSLNTNNNNNRNQNKRNKKKSPLLTKFKVTQASFGFAGNKLFEMTNDYRNGTINIELAPGVCLEDVFEIDSSIQHRNYDSDTNQSGSNNNGNENIGAPYPFSMNGNPFAGPPALAPNGMTNENENEIENDAIIKCERNCNNVEQSTSSLAMGGQGFYGFGMRNSNLPPAIPHVIPARNSWDADIPPSIVSMEQRNERIESQFGSNGNDNSVYKGTSTSSSFASSMASSFAPQSQILQARGQEQGQSQSQSRPQDSNMSGFGAGAGAGAAAAASMNSGSLWGNIDFAGFQDESQSQLQSQSEARQVSQSQFTFSTQSQLVSDNESQMTRQWQMRQEWNANNNDNGNDNNNTNNMTGSVYQSSAFASISQQDDSQTIATFNFSRSSVNADVNNNNINNNNGSGDSQSGQSFGNHYGGNGVAQFGFDESNNMNNSNTNNNNNNDNCEYNYNGEFSSMFFNSGQNIADSVNNNNDKTPFLTENRNNPYLGNPSSMEYQLSFPQPMISNASQPFGYCFSSNDSNPNMNSFGNIYDGNNNSNDNIMNQMTGASMSVEMTLHH